VQSQFRVEVRNEAGATVIVLSGELDLASSPALEEELARVFESDSRRVMIDLRALEFMDSTGLSLIVRAHQDASQAERELYLVKGPPQVQRLLTLTGVADRVSVIDTPEDVLAGD
jgi:stage II sporulation protein AA (anti-sigma F factor antagonist)